jgi:hypothetical protein
VAQSGIPSAGTVLPRTVLPLVVVYAVALIEIVHIRQVLRRAIEFQPLHTFHAAPTSTMVAPSLRWVCEVVFQ